MSNPYFDFRNALIKSTTAEEIETIVNAFSLPTDITVNNDKDKASLVNAIDSILNQAVDNKINNAKVRIFLYLF